MEDLRPWKTQPPARLAAGESGPLGMFWSSQNFGSRPFGCSAFLVLLPLQRWMPAKAKTGKEKGKGRARPPEECEAYQRKKDKHPHARPIRT